MKINRKRVRRTCYWLAAQLIVLAIFFVLLRHKPSDYVPPAVDDSGRISKYLTHELGQELYNNVQLQRSFELVILEEGIRDVIATSAWQEHSGDGTQLSRPTILFRKGHILAMMAANVQGVDFIATFKLVPEVDEQGLLRIVLDQADVGAVPMTLLVAPLAKKMYLEQTGGFVSEDLLSKVADSLFRQEPVDSAFQLDGRRARISGVTVEDGELRVSFTPVR